MHDSRRPLALFLAAAALAVALLGVADPADARHSRRESQGSETLQDGTGFTYYVLSLSWSPSYCASARPRAGDQQCGGARPYDFVVHGLWPQFDRGWPEDCAARGSASLADGQIERMLDLMPSRDLIRHEWQKHGTCSGLPTAEYFAAIRRTRESIRVPARFVAPRQYQTIAPDELKSEFLRANPQLSPDGIAVFCSGRDLKEVRICFDPALNPRACGGNEARQCRSRMVALPPVR